MGKYDIPAAIEYVLSKSGRSSLSYVGHSMGCAMFFIAMASRPELNAKIDAMFALAPATVQAHSKTNLRRSAPLVRQIVVMITQLRSVSQVFKLVFRFKRKMLHKMMGTTVYQPVDSAENSFRKMFCGANRLFQNSLCQNFVFTITSDGYKGLDLVITLNLTALKSTRQFKYHS